MKLNIFLFVVSLIYLGPSLCAWDRPRSISSTVGSTTSSPNSRRIGLERRVGKPDDDKGSYFEDSLKLEGIESTIINGTEQEERLFNRFSRHVFMRKKKKPFVRFLTVTQTTTVTALLTSSTVGLCAQLVNVTGPCRLRRGMWVDDPIVMSFDDEMDSIDEAFSPSKTLSIEMTAKPEEVNVAEGRGGDDVIKSHGMRDRRISVGSAEGVIHSSKEEERESRDDGDTEGRFGMRKIKKRIKSITVIMITVMTSTSTSTYYTTVSTKTFFIQLCTPSPFPFAVCNGRRKRKLEIE